MKKVRVFIDGFNLYHAIKGLNKPYLKWVDVRKLAECFIDADSEKITRVVFFTANPKHTPLEVQARYFAYTEALERSSFKKLSSNLQPLHFNIEWACYLVI